MAAWRGREVERGGWGVKRGRGEGEDRRRGYEAGMQRGGGVEERRGGEAER